MIGETETFWNLITNYPIIIPIIQRDYAQGREKIAVETIRTDFANVLHDSLMKSKMMSLDYIYGIIDESGFKPLDGQQRLTTLFLLHWYLLFKDDAITDKKEYYSTLGKFSYQTRLSSTRFCRFLTNGTFSQQEGPIRTIITNQKEYASSWNNDPTVKGMLVMLETIESTFQMDDISGCFNRLIGQNLITFRFLDIDAKQMNPSDELYIKMNARGKPLTPFELFKARFLEILSKEDKAKYSVSVNFDGSWLDFFWKFRPEKTQDPTASTDALFDSYVRFVVWIWNLREGKQPIEPDKFEWKQEKNVFTDPEKGQECIRFLFDSLESLSQLGSKQSLQDFFSTWFTKDAHEKRKVSLFDDVNLFESCIVPESNKNTFRNRLLLFVVLLCMINDCSDEDRFTITRLARNLTFGSENELRNENFPFMLQQLDDLCKDWRNNYQKCTAFNTNQMSDEQEKIDYIIAHPEEAEGLYELEDIPCFKGYLGAFDYKRNNIPIPTAIVIIKQNALSDEETVSLFSSALLAKGDFFQVLNWQNVQFANSKITLESLLRGSVARAKLQKPFTDTIESLSTQTSIEIIDQRLQWYQEQKVLDWRYYFLKYHEMNQGSGKFAWHSGDSSEIPNNEYWIAMLEKSRLSGFWRNPYLAALYAKVGDTAKKEFDKTIWNIGYLDTLHSLTINNCEISLAPNAWRFAMNDKEKFQEQFKKLKEEFCIDDTGTLAIGKEDDCIVKCTNMVNTIADWNNQT